MEWNNIDTCFQTCTALNKFKRQTLSLRPNAKAVFCIHDPIGLRYLFFLRVNLTPSEFCGCECAIEDISQFLLYTEQRRTPSLHVFALLRSHRLTYRQVRIILGYIHFLKKRYFCFTRHIYEEIILR